MRTRSLIACFPRANSYFSSDVKDIAPGIFHSIPRSWSFCCSISYERMGTAAASVLSIAFRTFAVRSMSFPGFRRREASNWTRNKESGLETDKIGC